MLQKYSNGRFNEAEMSKFCRDAMFYGIMGEIHTSNASSECALSESNKLRINCFEVSTVRSECVARKGDACDRSNANTNLYQRYQILIR